MGTSVIKCYEMITLTWYDGPRLIYLQTDHGIALMSYFDENQYGGFILKGGIIDIDTICELNNGKINCVQAMDRSKIFITYSLHTNEVLDQSSHYDYEEFMPEIDIAYHFTKYSAWS